MKYDANGYGKYIVIRHNNGLETIYGHLSKQIVSPNQTVRAGQPIGLGGNTGRSTGSHLHFETRLAGVALNPALFFDFAHQDVTGDYYVFRRSTVAQESDRATAARGTSSSLGYSRENIQGKGNRSYSPRQEKTYNTDFSSHTPLTEAAADGGRITYHKVVNGETLETIARQHGIAFDLKIADIARDGQIVQMAREEAQKIIDADPDCRKSEYNLLWDRLKALRKTNINWAAIS